MSIKAASPGDHQELTVLMRQAKAFWKYDPQQLADWQEELTVSPDFIREHQVFTVSNQESIIGFYAYSAPGNYLKLESLFVLPHYIRKGVGASLMNDFLARVQSFSARDIILDADPNAESFYRKFGFRTVSLKATSIPKRFMPVMVKPFTTSEAEEAHLFATSRLTVRLLAERDLDDFYDMQRNPKVMRFIKPPLSYEQSVEELRQFRHYYERREILFRIWAVVESATFSFVGLCGVYQNERHEYEIAYRLRERYWGHGFGSEMTNGLIGYCFNVLQYDELKAYVVAGNTGSSQIIQREMEFEREFYSEKHRWVEQVYRVRREHWRHRR